MLMSLGLEPIVGTGVVSGGIFGLGFSKVEVSPWASFVVIRAVCNLGLVGPSITTLGGVFWVSSFLFSPSSIDSEAKITAFMLEMQIAKGVPIVVSADRCNMRGH